MHHAPAAGPPRTETGPCRVRSSDPSPSSRRAARTPRRTCRAQTPSPEDTAVPGRNTAADGSPARVTPPPRPVHAAAPEYDGTRQHFGMLRKNVPHSPVRRPNFRRRPMAPTDLRTWAVKGAEQRLLEIADAARAIFQAFPELRERGRGFALQPAATAGPKPSTRRGRTPRGRRPMSAAARKA